MRALLAATAFLCASLPVHASADEFEPPHPVEGKWVVDLRLSLDDARYTQPMEISLSHTRVVTGSFYGSAIMAGRLGEAQGRSCIAFRTRDNSGPYHHAACLVDGKLVGQSWSEGRDFVNPWTAERKE